MEGLSSKPEAFSPSSYFSRLISSSMQYSKNGYMKIQTLKFDEIGNATLNDLYIKEMIVKMLELTNYILLLYYY